MLPWWVWLILIVIFANQVYIFSKCGCGTSGSGAGGSGGGGGGLPAIQLSGIQNITIVLYVATVFLGIAGYFYVATAPQYERKYMLFILHASLLVSILSLTVSSLLQLNAVV